MIHALLGVLRRNRCQLQVNPEARAVQEAVECEFDASLAELTPPKARLTAADGDLCGLLAGQVSSTEEEIDAVRYRFEGNETGPE